MSAECFSEGARGFIVSRLQRALGGLKVDEDFGPKTTAAVRDLQQRMGQPVTGDACEDTFQAVGLPFPSVFERCLNLTGMYEGTGFGGVNKRDIDGAGVTLGIVGFTTEHGEVQRLVTEYLRIKPSAANGMSVSAKGKLLALTKASGRNREAWDRWFYGADGVVDPWIRDVMKSWGQDELFQRLQLAMIETEMWLPVLRTAANLGFSDNLPALGLLFDTQVQNGGWKDRHQKHYGSLSQDGTMKRKLQSMALAVTMCSNPKWQSDVGSRKMTFVTGGGTVHGRYYDLADYGFGNPWAGSLLPPWPSAK